jgi:hypothetical protein
LRFTSTRTSATGRAAGDAAPAVVSGPAALSGAARRLSGVARRLSGAIGDAPPGAPAGTAAVVRAAPVSAAVAGRSVVLLTVQALAASASAGAHRKRRSGNGWRTAWRR